MDSELVFLSRLRSKEKKSLTFTYLNQVDLCDGVRLTLDRRLSKPRLSGTKSAFNAPMRFQWRKDYSSDCEILATNSIPSEQFVVCRANFRFDAEHHEARRVFVEPMKRC
jgi:hypothetical protein